MDSVWANILMMAGLAGMVAKVVVDLCKQGKIPDWVPLPALAAVVGVAVCFLLTVAAGDPVTAQRSAVNVLAGILAGGFAVGVTEIGRRADGYYEE